MPVSETRKQTKALLLRFVSIGGEETLFEKVVARNEEQLVSIFATRRDKQEPRAQEYYLELFQYCFSLLFVVPSCGRRAVPALEKKR